MSDAISFTSATRRQVFAAGAGLAALVLAAPARATPAAMEKAIRAFTGGAMPKEGRVKIDIPLLLETGASAATSVTVESPMTPADHVRRVAIFNERNPQPNVAVFHFSARSGRAAVSTRIRLGDSQKVVAVAEMSDGSFHMGFIEVIVTLPVCVEEA
jgi:sulfur-oxidizing protein SoxY